MFLATSLLAKFDRNRRDNSNTSVRSFCLHIHMATDNYSITVDVINITAQGSEGYAKHQWFGKIACLHTHTVPDTHSVPADILNVLAQGAEGYATR